MSFRCPRSHNYRSECEQIPLVAEEVSTVATTIPIEEDAGTFTGQVHLHNGYYAGDFGQE